MDACFVSDPIWFISLQVGHLVLILILSLYNKIILVPRVQQRRTCTGMTLLRTRWAFPMTLSQSLWLPIRVARLKDPNISSNNSSFVCEMFIPHIVLKVLYGSLSFM